VSVDDGPARRVFEVQPGDSDTSDLRHRLLIATWLAEGWERRTVRSAGTGAFETPARPTAEGPPSSDPEPLARRFPAL
jgi:hypothetical protein